MKMLDINSIVVSYNGKPILDHLSLELQAGEVLAVVGPNGAGKTSLIRVASGVLRPLSGSVFVSGMDAHHLSPLQRARYIAVVPQARELPASFTVLQTVRLGRTPYLNWFGIGCADDEEKVRQALSVTQLEALAGRRVGELSGGEQQRVLLARALAQDTPILLLDEPTAHLDLQHQILLLNLVRSAARQRGLAVLLALHDLNHVAMVADRVALIVKGKLQCVGAPGEVLSKEQIETAYGVHVDVISHPLHGTPLILPSSDDQRERVSF